MALSNKLFQFEQFSSFSDMTKRNYVSSSIWKNKLYVFGGIDTLNSSRFNDIDVFDFSTLKWSRLETEGEKPVKRSTPSAVIYNSYLYIFGGYSGSMLDDLWRINVEDSKPKWEKLITKGDKPKGTSCNSVALYKGSIYIFGGDSQFTLYYNTVHKIDISENSDYEWKLLKPKNNSAPRARSSSAMVVYKNSLIIFGGSSPNNHNDIWSFNIEEQTWEEIHPKTEVKPARRVGHGLFCVRDKMYLFNGYGDQIYHELYEFDLIKKTWKKLKTRGEFSERYYFATSFNMNDYRAWFFGGSGDSSNKLLTIKCLDPYYEDLRQLFLDQEFCDITFQTLENQKIGAHKLILNKRCGDIMEKIPETFEYQPMKLCKAFLHFVYTNSVEGLSIEESEKLLQMAQSIEYFELVEYLSNFDEIVDVTPIVKCFTELFQDDESKDFIIKVEEDEDEDEEEEEDEDEDEDEDEERIEEIKVHKLVLIMRSGLFKKMFKEVEESISEINDLSGLSSFSMENLIEFLYTGSLENIKSVDDAEELIKMTEYFILNDKRLQNKCLSMFNNF
ncbi:leucine-zipper-like transcriptional regulator 1 [Anaeramoeba flamelloides]|uniref:Leucine-zipper-like transcriptional regulator 1 n=1 Tax=Anaeramoeba flamelloides TaxID=1746091 RepID=A0ABQ8Z0F0_9EUKA|nr:leucine-zipper-like transcriptional regulator 1 [Anaeramoeba flamelloides]